MSLLTPFRPWPDVLAVSAALDAGDVGCLPILADAYEDAGHPEMAGVLRLAATDERPEMAAWRKVVSLGRAVGHNGYLRMALVAGLNGMASIEAGFYDRGDGTGMQPFLRVRAAGIAQDDWTAAHGWWSPPQDEAERDEIVSRAGRLYRRANGKLDVA